MSVNSIREDEMTGTVSKRETLVRLYSYLLSYKKKIAAVAVLLAATLFVTLATPLMIELAIDTYVARSDTPGLLKLAAVTFLLFLIRMLFKRGWMRIIADVTNQVLMTIRNQLYSHILTLSFRFFDTRPTGKILARIVGDINSLKDMLSDSVTKLIPDLLTLIGIACIMLIKNWQLALAALLTVPILAAGMFIIQITAHKLWQIYRQKNSNLNAYIHENFSGIRIIQSFAAEDERQADFDLCAQEYRDSFINAVKIADLFGALVEIIWGIGGFLLYFIGIRIIGAGKIGVGTFLAFSTYLGMFWSPIRNLASFYNKIITNISAAERVFDILDTPADITDLAESITLPEIKGAVSFEHVSFSYLQDQQPAAFSDRYDNTEGPGRFVLEDVSFHIAPGETIALVGPTGAGKTTIVNLISRFYDVTDGRIRIDGYDTRKVTLESLRKQMGVMTQDTFLFTGTIRENICYGNMDATEAEMIAAAKAVNAHDFIMKTEKGYDTEISERSSGLSIGQRQLLAFARTMLSDPGILILDEATSSIDTHTELLVQSGIEAMLKGRTSFIIAHRLSTIRNADRIFYVDDKNILETGNHEELMAKRGAYYHLYESQFEGVR